MLTFAIFTNMKEYPIAIMLVRKISVRWIVVYIIFFASVWGLAFGFADAYDYHSNLDVLTYTALARGDLDESPIRRYRIVVPALAGTVYRVLGPFLERVQPKEFPGDFPLIFSFVLVNSLLMAGYFTLLMRLCLHFLEDGERAFTWALMGVMGVLTCRWTLLLAGSALVDSLLMIAIVLMVGGVLMDRHRWLVWALYIGLWAKESFVFYLPLVLFYRGRKWPLLGHLVVAGVTVLAFRLWLDSQIGAAPMESVHADVEHIFNVGLALSRLFSFHGLYEVLSIGGVWNVFLFWALSQRERWALLVPGRGGFWAVFFAAVVVQMLLSTELSRMLYMTTPWYGIVLARIFSALGARGVFDFIPSSR